MKAFVYPGPRRNSLGEPPMPLIKTPNDADARVAETQSLNAMIV